MPTIGVAIAIPEPWATELQDYRQDIGDPTADGVPSHITLIPPIDVGDDLAEIEGHLGQRRAAARRLPGASARNGYLPARVARRLHRSRGRDLPVRAAGRRRAVRPLGLDLNFPYHPHVTVAHHLGDDELDRAFDDLAAFECSFDVADFHLYVHAGELGWQPSRTFPLNRDS